MAFSNYHRNYGITLSTGTPVFLFNRLLESRLADDYLEQQCKIEQLKSCKYLQDLPRTTFLWGPHPLITEMGGWLGARAESKQIVYGTLRRHPFQFLAECGKQMFRQFVAFEPGVDNYPYEAGPTVDAIQRLYPGDAPKFQLTKQQSGRLHLLAEKLSRWYEVVFWTALVGCAVLFLRRYARSSPANRLFLTVLIFLFANALVTASVSLVAHRLQSRVSWIIVLCCAAYGVDRECSTRSTK